MGRALLICLAGALGTGARYGAALASVRLFGAGIPWGTLFVNVVGSFLLAAIAVLGAQSGGLSPTAKLVFGTGFCGGFTTYSAFNQETFTYLQDGAVGRAALYVVGTVAVCLLAGLAGWGLASWAVAR